VGTRLRRSVHKGRFIEVGQGFHVVLLGVGCSFRFPGVLGTEVGDVWDGSWRHYFTA
jgi:hypothetical protein